MPVGRNAAAPVLPAMLRALMSPVPLQCCPGTRCTRAPASLRIVWMMLRFCWICAALRKSLEKAPKSVETTGPGPRRLHLQRPACVCDVWGEVSLQRTSDFQGCQVGLVWLGPRAAAWAAHRVSQVCLSALEVDQSTSDSEGGDSKEKSRVFIVDYVMSPSGWHTSLNGTYHKKSVPVVLSVCLCYSCTSCVDLVF